MGGDSPLVPSRTPLSPADITLIDPDHEWVVDTDHFASKGKNTPFQGTSFRGKVVGTMVGGEVRYLDDGYGVGVCGRDQDLGRG